MLKQQSSLKAELEKEKEEANAALTKSSEWETRYRELEVVHYRSTMAYSKTSVAIGSRDAERHRRYEENGVPLVDSGYWPKTPNQTRGNWVYPLRLWHLAMMLLVFLGQP